MYSINYHLILVVKYRHKCINNKLSSSLYQIMLNFVDFYTWLLQIIFIDYSLLNQKK
ncbi:transposase [Borreliella americana]|uniref:transposase n=1 Tax=Borreliella americana TaxID=478807 RepID=UPI0038B3DC32